MASGRVYVHHGARGQVWRAAYRLPNGRRHHRTIGPVWKGRGRPPVGHFTRRLAEEWLREVLEQARAGTLPGLTRTGVSFARACDDYVTHKTADRRLKPTTLRNYQSIIDYHLFPAFGQLAVEELTTEMVEAWKLALPMSNTTKIQILTVLYGVMERARKRYKLRANPVRDVEKPRREVAPGGELRFYEPEEVFALVRAADGEQDTALYLAAAFTGLRRGELVALRWRNVDFPNSVIRVAASVTDGVVSSPKSGKVRSIPMAPEVAEALARLNQREDWTADDDLVFPGITGGYLDASALYRRFIKACERAGLRRLRFHDLRHTFGTVMAANPRVDMRRLQEWMGHADISTTLRYAHYRPRHDDAALVAEAFGNGSATVRATDALLNQDLNGSP